MSFDNPFQRELRERFLEDSIENRRKLYRGMERNASRLLGPEKVEEIQQRYQKFRENRLDLYGAATGPDHPQERIQEMLGEYQRDVAKYPPDMDSSAARFEKRKSTHGDRMVGGFVFGNTIVGEALNIGGKIAQLVNTCVYETQGEIAGHVQWKDGKLVSPDQGSAGKVVNAALEYLLTTYPDIIQKEWETFGYKGTVSLMEQTAEGEKLQMENINRLTDTSKFLFVQHLLKAFYRLADYLPKELQQAGYSLKDKELQKLYTDGVRY